MTLYEWLLLKQNISPMVNRSWIFCMYNIWKTNSESEKQQAKRLWQGIRR
jgi:hypothetical protein